MKTIVVALDLDTGSEAVLARAVQLAAAHGARLAAIHVIEADWLSQAAAGSDLSESELRGDLARTALASMETALADHGRTRRSLARVEFGSPHDALARVAEEMSADLVIVGPHRGRSLKGKILGSTADRIVRTSCAPVLVVRRPPEEPYRHVVVAVDFSPQSAAAARAARELAPQATLRLVHVTGLPPTFEQALLRAGRSPAEVDRYRSARAAKARENLSAFTQDVAGPGKTVLRLAEGDPGRTLVRLARSRRVDLMVLGPHGRGVVLRALLGSVTQRVLATATCDVLIASTRH
ncbi:universal stress protein [Polymorphum gilvum]|uniref:Universal stress protein uspA n=1 Tax=Polymorphum gilvum (strain LMG 25793 / CGMCC 1.9160 / SL003B-26A1) TaxID=991905 RepID=F2IXD1_POLGS|nr:universal stress protein [Polymorphum gilvum]ADZ70449.1 Universal stress protein uspA [Polymorphum gilvum SL003B-26A1]